MRVEFTGRHIEVTEPIRQFATERLERIRSVHDVIEAHFVLSAEKHQRHVAEINLKTRHDFLHCEDVTSDMYTSIASVLDKVERQVRKSKTRHMKRRRSGSAPRVIEARSVAEVEPVVAEKLPEIVRADSRNVKPLSVDDAAANLGGDGGTFLLFRNSETDRLNLVYRRSDGDIGWIDPER